MLVLYTRRRYFYLQLGIDANIYSMVGISLNLSLNNILGIEVLDKDMVP